jgi:hypothetical protein
MVDFTGSINNADFTAKLDGATGLNLDAFTELLNEASGASGTAEEYSAIFDAIDDGDGTITEEEFMAAAGTSGATGTDAKFDAEDIAALSAATPTDGATGSRSLDQMVADGDVTIMTGADGHEYIYVEPGRDDILAELQGQFPDANTIETTRSQAEIADWISTNGGATSLEGLDEADRENASSVQIADQTLYLPENLRPDFEAWLQTTDPDDDTDGGNITPPTDPAFSDNQQAINTALGLPSELNAVTTINQERQDEYEDELLNIINGLEGYESTTMADIENLEGDDLTALTTALVGADTTALDAIVATIIQEDVAAAETDPVEPATETAPEAEDTAATS